MSRRRNGLANSPFVLIGKEDVTIANTVFENEIQNNLKTDSTRGGSSCKVKKSTDSSSKNGIKAEVNGNKGKKTSANYEEKILSESEIQDLLRRNSSDSSSDDPSLDSDDDDLWTVAGKILSPNSLNKANFNDQNLSPSIKTKKNLTVSPIKLRRKVPLDVLAPTLRSPLKVVNDENISVSPKSLRDRSELKRPLVLGVENPSVRKSPRLSVPHSIRSPSPSLRKQVLEARTPRSSTKLPEVQEEESTEEEDEIQNTKASLRQSLLKTPERPSQSPLLKKKVMSPRSSIKLTNLKEEEEEDSERSTRYRSSQSPRTPRSLSSKKQALEAPSPKLLRDLKEEIEEGSRVKPSSPRLCSVQSPRTPSLRRQVLEARTPQSLRKHEGTKEDKTPSGRRSLRRSSRQATPEREVSSDSETEWTPDSVRKSVRKRLTLTPSKATTPVKNTPSKITPSKGLPATPSKVSTPSSVKRVGRGFLTPSVAERSSRINGTPSSELERVRIQLHVSTVPTSLPCREREFQNVRNFLLRKIEDQAGGCMYISGVPGTGKTATVHAVVRELQQKACDGDISSFDFVEVNGLRLTEPRQAYVRILQGLTGDKVTTDQAQNALEKRFCGKNKRSSILLVDEVDYLCNRRQDVIYNLLEWTTKHNSKLVVLTIANTMDLPERTLKGKVTSRMGLTRLVFQPYTYQQLQQIVLDRLGSTSSFHPDAVQLVARKVAAVSGDARRALDICRRATELVDNDSESVSLVQVEKALSQIFSGARVLAIKSCSKMWQLVLRAMRDETSRTGVEETSVGRIFTHLKSLCAFESVAAPTVGQVLDICSGLEKFGLIIAEKERTDLERKLSLNVSSDDIHYALHC